jgi:hypothetical protein
MALRGPWVSAMNCLLPILWHQGVLGAPTCCCLLCLHNWATPNNELERAGRLAAAMYRGDREAEVVHQV